MTIAFVQAAHQGSANAVTSDTVTWGSATTTGNLLVALLQFYGNPGTITPPSGGWTLIQTDSTGNSFTYLYYIANAVSQSGAQQWNWVNSLNTAAIIMAEYSGCKTANVLDGTAGVNHGTGTTVTTGNDTTTGSNDLIIAAVGIASTTSTSPTLTSITNGFNTRDTVGLKASGFQGAFVWLLDNLNQPAATYNTGGTAANQAAWSTVIEGFAGSGAKLLPSQGVG
jgi:hypothetical protein